MRAGLGCEQAFVASPDGQLAAADME